MSISLSVVIPHLNQWENLEKCLSALLPQLKGIEQEVIIVDNGSVEREKHTVPKGVKLITAGEKSSPYYARNKGISEAVYPRILLLDVNCFLLPGAIAALLEEQGDTPALVAALPEIGDENGLSMWQKFDAIYSMPSEEQLREPKAAPMGCLLIHHRIREEIGEFPEERALSDMAWTAMARKAGFQVMYCKKAKYAYPFKDKKAFLKKFRRLGGGMIAHGFKRSRLLYLGKQFLPPSPQFMRNCRRKSEKYGLSLRILEIFYLCYMVKIQYGIGGLQKLLS